MNEKSEAMSNFSVFFKVDAHKTYVFLLVNYVFPIFHSSNKKRLVFG